MSSPRLRVVAPDVSSKRILSIESITHLCVLTRILPSTAPVKSARSALRPVAREAITPIHAPALGRAARGICRLERRREQELLQLAKCPFGKLARPALAHPKYKQLVSVRAQLAVQAAFEKEDVVVRVAIWSTVDVVRQPSAARAQPPTARIKRPRSRSKHKAGTNSTGEKKKQKSDRAKIGAKMR